MKKEIINNVQDNLNQYGVITETANFGDRSYPMLYGKNVVSKLDLILDIYKFDSKILIITEDKLVSLFKDKIEDSLASRKQDINWLSVSGKEEDKNIDVILNLYQSASELGIDKSSSVIALGGGVIQDMVNYFASTYNRGIKFIQIPTTVLSQADIGIGGCAVNHPAGKSLIGQFYQPILSILDEEFLYSLPESEISSGLAEVINKVVCLGGIHNENIIKDMNDMVSGDYSKLMEYIRLSNKVKREIIENDEIGINGGRLLLDWGHTVTHALERILKYKIGHGFALGIGMVSAANLSVNMDILAKDKSDLLKEIIIAAKLPTTLPKNVSAEDVIKSLDFDQKKLKGDTRFILMKDFGKCFMSESISDESIAKVLEDQIEN